MFINYTSIGDLALQSLDVDEILSRESFDVNKLKLVEIHKISQNLFGNTFSFRIDWGEILRCEGRIEWLNIFPLFVFATWRQKTSAGYSQLHNTSLIN